MPSIHEIMSLRRWANGGVSIGAGYLGTTPPTNGAIIQGWVGIGRSPATFALEVADAIWLRKGFADDTRYYGLILANVDPATSSEPTAFSTYNATGVLAAKQIALIDGISALIFLCGTDDGGTDFLDLILAGWALAHPGGGISVIHSLTVSGAPPARTYTKNAAAPGVNLALGGAVNYLTHAFIINIGRRRV